jgi:aspartyl protease family protein
MRGLVVLVIGIAFCATLIAQIASHSASPSRAQVPGAAQNASDGEAERLAELKSRDNPQFSSQDGSELDLERSSDGQFYADVRINGAPVHMMIDTGASSIALSRSDAQMAGIATDIGMNDVVGEGADGAVHGQYVRLDRVELGPLTAEGLPAIILNSGGQSLLGQSFLSRFSSVHIEGDKMILR